jgi:hypothetical protein
VRGHYRFPVSVFCFFGSIFRELNGSRILVVAGTLCDLDCLLQGFDFAPVVSRWALPALAAMSERQKEFVRLSVFRVASAAAQAKMLDKRGL